MCWFFVQRSGFLHSADAQGLNDIMGGTPRPSPLGKGDRRRRWMRRGTAFCIVGTIGAEVETFLRIRLLFLQHFTLPRGPHQARPGEPASPKGSFCTVLLGGTIQPHGLYSKRSGRLVAAPTGVIPFIHTGYTRKVPGTAHRPFPTYSNGKAKMNNVGRPNNCQLSIVNFAYNCQLSTVNCQLSSCSCK